MPQVAKGLVRLQKTACHAVLMLYRLLYARIHPIMNKDIYICISVDGDLPRDRVIADKAIRHTIHFFRRAGILNKVTWFINDGGIAMPLASMPDIKSQRFCWSQEHPEQLRDLVEEGCDIELHSHYMQGYWESNGEQPVYELLLKNIREEKERIESFIRNCTGEHYTIIGFRSGSYVASADLHRVLEALRFKFDSSEVPGLKGSQGLKHCFVDYSEIPLPRNWHYLGDQLLELPLYLMTMDVDAARICAKSLVVLSFHAGHPFEFVDGKRERRKLRELLISMQLRVLRLCYPRAHWVAMRDIPEVIKKYRDATDHSLLTI